MKVTHFKDAAALRRWFDKNHHKAPELWVGFYKKASGRTGASYQEAVDLALCFGWIDGIRKRVDDVSYTNRFTPRRARSIWSLINIRRVAELTKRGLMAEPGLTVFKARDPRRSGLYSFENRPKALPKDLEKIFKADKPAWTFWQAQPPGYRRMMSWFVLSAAKDETRRKRLATLMDACAAGRRIVPMQKQQPSS